MHPVRIFMIGILSVSLCLSGCGSNKQASEKQDSGSSSSASEPALVNTVKIGEKEMDYLHFGKENGEAFVILPGLALKSVMGSAEGIKTAYALLADQYDVYLFDHIRTEPEGYSIADMADDTIAAFDQLGLDHVHLMGVSMGGMVSQTIALKDPERVSSLILCSTAMNTAHSETAVFEEWKTLAEKQDTPALMESFGTYVYSPSFYAQYKDAIISSGDGASEQDFRNFLISLEAIRNFDVSGEIQKITCPVLVMGAGEDRVVGPEAAEDLIRALNCSSFIYEGYGHGVYDEAPDYLTHIDEFLRSR